MVTTKRLIMTFVTALGRTVSLSVDDPREDVTEADIKDFMDLVVDKNIFAPYDSEITSAKDAKIVVTDTSQYDLVL